MKHVQLLRTRGALVAPLALALALAGCGSSALGAAASATATPTCPPATAALNFKTVTGSVSAVSGNGFTVTDASGKVTQVQIGSNAVITKIVSGSPADLAAGTAVQVVTDTNATTAQRIRVLGSGAESGRSGFAGFGGRTGSATPPAGVNPACFRRARGQGQGSGQGQGQGQSQGQGSGFQGLRGTVDSATSTKLVFDDAQGQTYSVAITSSTVIQKISAAKASDVQPGMHVTVAGTTSSTGITARSVTIQSA